MSREILSSNNPFLLVSFLKTILQRYNIHSSLSCKDKKERGESHEESSVVNINPFLKQFSIKVNYHFVPRICLAIQCLKQEPSI